jgi:fused signal recognition particle receptor
MARTWQDVFITPDGRGEVSPTATDDDPQRRGFFRRLRENLSKSREALGGELRATFSGPLDDATWERLEEVLIYADVGARTTAKVVERL